MIESDSKVNLLSARVIIWRIIKHLESSDHKPIFILRRFNTFWLPTISKVLQHDLNFTIEETNQIINALDEVLLGKRITTVNQGILGEIFVKTMKE